MATVHLSYTGLHCQGSDLPVASLLFFSVNNKTFNISLTLSLPLTHLRLSYLRVLVSHQLERHFAYGRVSPPTKYLHMLTIGTSTIVYQWPMRYLTLNHLPAVEGATSALNTRAEGTFKRFGANYLQVTGTGTAPITRTCHTNRLSPPLWGICRSTRSRETWTPFSNRKR